MSKEQNHRYSCGCFPQKFPSPDQHGRLKARLLPAKPSVPSFKTDLSLKQTRPKLGTCRCQIICDDDGTNCFTECICDATLPCTTRLMVNKKRKRKEANCCSTSKIPLPSIFRCLEGKTIFLPTLGRRLGYCFCEIVCDEEGNCYATNCQCV